MPDPIRGDSVDAEQRLPERCTGKEALGRPGHPLAAFSEDEESHALRAAVGVEPANGAVIPGDDGDSAIVRQLNRPRLRGEAQAPLLECGPVEHVEVPVAAEQEARVSGIDRDGATGLEAVDWQTPAVE